jgi:hypothetical protein
MLRIQGQKLDLQGLEVYRHRVHHRFVAKWFRHGHIGHQQSERYSQK